MQHDEAEPVFGVAFVEVDAYTREEIARFIHAVQLGQLRERSERR
jgi:c-di-GMP-binding flagellar brake protein YcgR